MSAAGLQSPDSLKWICTGAEPLKWWITAATAVAALGILSDKAGASVVVYQLTGPVNEAPHDPTLIGQSMYLRWSADSADIVHGSWATSVSISWFEYGVTGTNDQWAGTGGTFSFSSYQLTVQFLTSKTAYTRQGSFETSNASFTYWGSPPVSGWNADGLPMGFAINFLAVSTAPFMVRDASSTSLIRMNQLLGVTIATVPETSSAALLGLGALAALRRRKRSHD